MDMNLKSTPFLVLFIVLVASGIGVAYAVGNVIIDGNMTVTGDTQVDGNLNVDGTITNADLSFSIKFKTILDDAAGNAAGWDPDGVAQNFQIDDDDVTENSFVIVGIGGGGTFFFGECEQTIVLGDNPQSQGKDFSIIICPPIANGFQLRYTIITP